MTRSVSTGLRLAIKRNSHVQVSNYFYLHICGVNLNWQRFRYLKILFPYNDMANTNYKYRAIRQSKRPPQIVLKSLTIWFVTKTLCLLSQHFCFSAWGVWYRSSRSSGHDDQPLWGQWCQGEINFKHCQRHNGPEGWVLLTKVTYFSHIKRSNTKYWPSTNFKISTLANISISTKLKIQDIDQTWPQNLDQDSTSLPLQNISSKILTKL